MIFWNGPVQPGAVYSTPERHLGGAPSERSFCIKPVGMLWCIVGGCGSGLDVAVCDTQIAQMSLCATLRMHSSMHPVQHTRT